MQQTHVPHDIPALGFYGLTRCYDLAVALTTRERTFNQALIGQAVIDAGAEVGTLAYGTAIPAPYRAEKGGNAT